MPVVRQIYWKAVIPQIAIIVGCVLVAHQILPRGWRGNSVLFGALFYWLFCRIMRSIFTKDHRAGMKAYQAQRFEKAITHFEASCRYFQAHPRLDRWRSLLFGVSSLNSYQTMALCNAAFCHAQMGNGQKATEVYEEALRTNPDCTLAKTSLAMLRSMGPAASAPAAS